MDTKSFLMGAGLGAVALVGNMVLNYKLGKDHGINMYALGLSHGHKMGMNTCKKIKEEK